MFSGRATVTPVRKFKGNETQSSQKYTVICLTVIGICLLGTGAALIAVGKSFDVEDLLILGPVFLVAGLGFTVLMIVIITRPICEERIRKGKIKKEKKKMKKQSKTNMKNGVDAGEEECVPYISNQNHEKWLAETDNVHNLGSPPKTHLYGINKTNSTKNQGLVTNHPDATDVLSEGYITDELSECDSKEILEKKLQKDDLYGPKQMVQFNQTSINSNPTPPPGTSEATGSDFQCSRPGSSIEKSKIPEVPMYSYATVNTPLPNEIEISYL